MNTQQTQSTETYARCTLVSAAQKGDYVKRKADSTKVYIRGGCVSHGKNQPTYYELIDAEDLSRSLYVRSTTTVFVDFTY